jgi:hypothetical protein
MSSRPSPESRVQSPESRVQSPESRVHPYPDRGFHRLLSIFPSASTMPNLPKEHNITMNVYIRRTKLAQEKQSRPELTIAFSRRVLRAARQKLCSEENNKGSGFRP